jgi:hypothetical protein
LCHCKRARLAGSGPFALRIVGVGRGGGESARTNGRRRVVRDAGRRSGAEEVGGNVGSRGAEKRAFAFASAGVPGLNRPRPFGESRPCQ